MGVARLVRDGTAYALEHRRKHSSVVTMSCNVPECAECAAGHAESGPLSQLGRGPWRGAQPLCRWTYAIVNEKSAGDRTESEDVTSARRFLETSVVACPQSDDLKTEQLILKVSIWKSDRVPCALSFRIASPCSWGSQSQLKFQD